jgi:hypothetical protein
MPNDQDSSGPELVTRRWWSDRTDEVIMEQESQCHGIKIRKLSMAIRGRHVESQATSAETWV